MLGLGGISIKCVQEDYNLYSKSIPSVKIVKFNKGLSTGQGHPFACLRVMYQSIPSLTIPPPWAKPLGNFFDGRIPHPRAKRVQNPHPRAYKKELKPHPQGHFPQLFTITRALRASNLGVEWEERGWAYDVSSSQRTCKVNRKGENGSSILT